MICDWEYGPAELHLKSRKGFLKHSTDHSFSSGFNDDVFTAFEQEMNCSVILDGGLSGV